MKRAHRSHCKSTIPPEARGSQAGFSLVEILIVAVILAVAFNLLANAMVSSNKLAPMNRETSQAMDALRIKIEEIKGTTFNEIWSTYNADPTDDPGGAGSAEGNFFAVDVLQVRTNDVDGFVGEVLFPTIGGDLREDTADRDLGMPRDLNGDGAIDALSHAADYTYLPFSVRLEWRSKHGIPRQLEVFTAVAQP